MDTTKQIAKHIREIHFGGNWTWSNLKDTLADVTWQQATTKVGSFNTIVALTYHINYFVDAILNVLQGNALDSKDKYSFDHPPINSQEDWEKLGDFFVYEKYGIYYRNLHGLIEHSHYHLGQIVIIKKLVQAEQK